MNFVDRLWESYKKELQKSSAKRAGSAILQKIEKVKKNSQKAIKNERELADSSIGAANNGLEEVLKGQFASKVSETLQDQKELLESIK